MEILFQFLLPGSTKRKKIVEKELFLATCLANKGLKAKFQSNANNYINTTAKRLYKRNQIIFT